ncbi:MmgE/PrpD family protein [Paralcaligenes ureilyticus]|uniref:2-methylcitrate dehydratase PrpD n=1 Tax=Paralcaligenes ureilyticus TaxID=627131 RepID=A0A4R3MCE0_9BURK|nr:MmgE/PrpD family protein [Paralcaligenes ureilyticus]TCT11066.1 2-methylcitrate dehydratase PrpD [Paralcaligenes ureilyticus]
METRTPAAPSSPVSAQLAAFISDASWEVIPDHIRHEAKRSVLNYFAVALAGCNDPTLDRAVETYARFSAGPQATLVGRRERLDMLNAGALNAMSANVYDYDDTHIPTIIHPTSPVASSLFAFSETQPLSGKDFMLAFVLGVEAQCRIGLAISPFHYNRGWHITSTCGVFGSAMAIGKTLKLTPTELCWALGSAACQAGGLVESLGTMSKSVSVGNAARNGMLAALLAKEGFDGPAQPLEGVNGFLRVFGDEPNFSAVTRSLGESWEIAKVAYKPYPCGVVLNPVLDACLALSARIDPRRLDTIESIDLTGHPLLRQRTDRPDIKTGRESQVSAQHAVPVSLLRGSAGLDAFSDQAVGDPKLRALGSLLRFHDDETYSIDSAKVMLRFRDQSTEQEHVQMARGSLQRPLTDDEIEAKLRDLCRYGRSGCDAGRLIQAVWDMEDAADMGRLARLAEAPN